jgi:hypothetical protein
MAWFRVLALGALALLLPSACIGDGSDDEPTEIAQPGPSISVADQTATAEFAATPSAAPTADVAATAQAAGCQVTAASANAPARWIGTPVQPVWYEAAELWISPVSYAGADPILFDEDPGVWFAGTSLLTVVPPTWDDPVEITGSGTEGQAGEVNYLIEDQHPDFGMTGFLTIPEPGCWEIEVSAGKQSMTLTVYALPFEQRADVAWALAAREEMLSTLFPVPADCAVTEPTLASPDASAHLWYIGEGIEAVFDPPGVFWAGEEVGMLWYPEPFGDLELTGTLEDDPSLLLRTSLMQQTGRGGERWAATVVFPAPGCWALTASTTESTLEATVYVYPFECFHEADHPAPEDCRPPDV